MTSTEPRTGIRSVRFLDLPADHAEVRDELDAIWSETVGTGAFVGGGRVAEFERDFAAYQGADHAVGVANGTDALELILDALDIGPGDEVIVPANTFIATAEAVVRVGATPIFVDVDRDTLLITADTIAPAITSSTAAVMVVHLYGQMADLDTISALTARHDLALIEDAAQAHGAEWQGRRAGSSTTAAAFSFYPGKNLGAMGDGGAVVTGDPALAERVRSISNHGRSTSSRYEHDLLGRNSRLDALQAGALAIKLRRLDAWNAHRRQVHQWYRRHLPAGVVPVAVRPEALPVHHLEVVRVPAGTREAIGRRLDDHGIQWGIHYPVPCHRQAALGAAGIDLRFPETDAAADRILSLPMHPHLTEDEVQYVSEVLREHPGLA